MEVCLVKRFVPFLITTVIVLLPIALFLTVQRGAFFRSRLEGHDWRQRIHAARAETAPAAN